MLRLIILAFSLLIASPANAGYTAADAADDVTISDNILYENEAFTATIWVKTNGSQASYANALYIDNIGDVSWEIAFDLAHVIGGGLRPYFFVQTSPSDDGLCESSSTITDGEWTHLAIKHTGSQVEGFVDGASVCTDASTGTVNYDTSPLIISESFIGDVDQVCLWDTNLSDGQIAQIADSKIRGIELQIAPSNLVDCWYLDDYSEGTSLDTLTFTSIKGTGDGTVSGGASIVAINSEVSYP